MESPVLRCIRPYTVSALVLDFLSPEEKSLWGRLRVVHSLVVGVVVHDLMCRCVEGGGNKLRGTPFTEKCNGHHTKDWTNLFETSAG
jgi:hypothetical protein